MKILLSTSKQDSISSVLGLPGARIFTRRVPFPVSIWFLFIQRYSDTKLRLYSSGNKKSILIRIFLKELFSDFRFHSPYYLIIFKLFLVEIKLETQPEKMIAAKLSQYEMNRMVFSRSAILDMKNQDLDSGEHFFRTIQREGIYTPSNAIKNEIKQSLFIWRIGVNHPPMGPIHVERFLLKKTENRKLFDISTLPDGLITKKLLRAKVSKGLYAEQRDVLFPNSPYFKTEISPSVSFLSPFFDKDNQIRVIPPSDLLYVDSAVFAGFNSNYYHFTWEIAPRLIAFYDEAGTRGIPTVLNKQIPSTLVELVKEISGTKPILLGDDQQAVVAKLYVVFDGRYASPVDYKDNTNTNIFAPRGQDLIRIRELTSKMGHTPSGKGPRKIFVGRPKFDVRVPSNLEEVRNFLFSNSFQEISVDSISVREQISIFRNAEEICIITGAAVTNLVYCQNLKKLVILVIDQSAEFMVFWHEYCKFLGIKATFIYSENLKSRFGPIDVAELNSALS